MVRLIGLRETKRYDCMLYMYAGPIPIMKIGCGRTRLQEVIILFFIHSMRSYRIHTQPFAGE